MAAVDAIQNVVKHCQSMIEMVMQDLTDDEANWLPPGTANSIGITYLHVLNYHDFYVNEVAQGKAKRWETEGWEARLGYSNAMKMHRNTAASTRYELAALKPYADAVFADAAAFVDTLADDDLDREVQGYRGPVPLGTMLTRSAAYHVFLHLGEISALKGVQGLRGLPF